MKWADSRPRDLKDAGGQKLPRINDEIAIELQNPAVRINYVKTHGQFLFATESLKC